MRRRRRRREGGTCHAESMWTTVCVARFHMPTHRATLGRHVLKNSINSALQSSTFLTISLFKILYSIIQIGHRNLRRSGKFEGLSNLFCIQGLTSPRICLWLCVSSPRLNKRRVMTLQEFRVFSTRLKATRAPAGSGCSTLFTTPNFVASELFSASS